MHKIKNYLCSLTLTLCLLTLNAFADSSALINTQIEEFAKTQHIDNMQVGINSGQQHYVVKIGDEKQYPINSMSKTFTTLALAYAANQHQIKLTNTIKQYFPKIKGYPISSATLLNLATHTSGLPLSIKSPLGTDNALIKYLSSWKPNHPIGSYRIYSNLGIGLIGKVLQKATHTSYPKYIHKIILQPFSMQKTEVNPPNFHLFNADSVFLAADGIVSNAHDMNMYLCKMMQEGSLPRPMKKAIHTVFTDYYQTSYFRDDFGWQAYQWPLTQKNFLKSASMKSLNTPAKAVYNQLKNENKLLVKTGSGHGYTSIMAFIPKSKSSVVILIHKNTSMKSRMKLAYDILHLLTHT